jgi:hypothetical protein
MNGLPSESYDSRIAKLTTLSPGMTPTVFALNLSVNRPWSSVTPIEVEPLGARG